MNRRLGFTLWLIGLPGVLLLAAVLAQSPRPNVPGLPHWWVIALVSGLQGVLLLSVAVVVGTRLAPRIGLQAPLLSALLARQPIPDLIRARLLPAVLGAAVGILILILYSAALPAEMRELQQQRALPLMVRLLYGGFTEEILVRWGLMTGIAWLLWRMGRGQEGLLSPWMASTAIVITALVFGVAHLPAAQALLGGLDAPLIGLIVLSNALFGVIAGALYWRYGLESAMCAHVMAHLGFWLWAG